MNKFLDYFDYEGDEEEEEEVKIDEASIKEVLEKDSSIQET